MSFPSDFAALYFQKAIEELEFINSQRNYFFEEDLDTFFFSIIYFPTVLVLNAFHIYIMIWLSDFWAEGSFILYMNTAFHLMQSFFSILLVYKDSDYLYRFKDLRVLSLISAYFTLLVYILGIILEIYLIYEMQQVAGFLAALYLGYILLIDITIVPESAVIVIYESRLNIIDRNPEEYFFLTLDPDNPDGLEPYFSMFEFVL